MQQHVQQRPTMNGSSVHGPKHEDQRTKSGEQKKQRGQKNRADKKKKNRLQAWRCVHRPLGRRRSRRSSRSRGSFGRRPLDCAEPRIGSLRDEVRRDFIVVEIPLELFSVGRGVLEKAFLVVNKVCSDGVHTRLSRDSITCNTSTSARDAASPATSNAAELLALWRTRRTIRTRANAASRADNTHVQAVEEAPF